MIRRAALAIALLFAAAPAAAAEDCTLKLAAWLDAELTPNGMFVIPAVIDGRRARLALDTGAFASFLTRAFVEAAGMQPKTYPGGFARDATGRVLREYVAANNVEIGALKSKGEYEFGITDGRWPFDGTLGLANKSFSAFDVEIDFAQKKVGFYLQDHCPGQVVYWANRYDVIPFQDRGGYLTFYVTLDGKRLNALMDTGAAHSVLDKDAARLSFGIVPDYSRLKKPWGIAALSGRVARAYPMRFKALDLPGVTFSNVPIIVADTVGLDLTLGMHELRAMHLYIAYKERKIYFTATSPAALARDVFAFGDLIDSGAIHANNGDYAKALAAFEQAVALDPARPEGYMMRGRIKSVRDDFAGAIADLSHAIGLDPDNVTALAYRGDAYQNSGAYELALADIMATMRLDPENTGNFATRGVVHFALGRYAEAASDFEQVSNAARDVPYWPLWLHLTRMKQGSADAKALMSNVAKVDRNAWPWPVIALFQGKMTPEQVRAASAVGDDATKKAQACEAAFYIGEYELGRNNAAAAIPLFQEAASTCPRDFMEYHGARAELKRLVPQQAP